MAYTDDLALIIRYDGAKTAFDAVKNNYLGKVVFITGTTAAPQQAIWVSDDGGGKYLNMSDIDTIKDQLTHLNIISDGSTYKDWTGGKGLAFKGTNGVTVSIVEKSYNVDGVATPFFDIVYDTSALQDAINTNTTNLGTLSTTVGGLGTDMTSVKGTVGTHTTQISQLQSKDTELSNKITEVTTKAGNNETTIGKHTEAISDINESLNTINSNLTSKADLGDDGKILESQLPDYLLGQVIFGGLITAVSGASSITVTPSNLFKDKFNVTSSSVTINSTAYNIYEGVYFILNAAVNAFGLDTTTGDWVISTGNAWKKVDNTDAVSSVAGLTGAIQASALAAKLAATGDTNELALKSEVTAVKVTASSSNTELITTSVDSAGRAVTITPTTKLSTAVALAESAVQEIEFETTSDYINTSSSTEEDTTTLNFEIITATVDPEDTANGIATAEDVRSYLAARLAVKVVS